MTTTKPGHPIRTRDPVEMQRVEWVCVVIAALITIAVGFSLPLAANRADITIRNPTEYRLYVSASTPDDASRTLVAIVGAQSTGTASVIDRGADWTLHVQSTGTHAETVDATRSQLTSGDYTIPVAVGDRFTAAGAVPDVDLDQPAPENSTSD